jgi:hypothetical protein
MFERFSMVDMRSSGKGKSEDDIKDVGFARIFGGARRDARFCQTVFLLHISINSILSTYYVLS